jgi:hypothetical protein
VAVVLQGNELYIYKDESLFHIMISRFWLCRKTSLTSPVLVEKVYAHIFIYMKEDPPRLVLTEELSLCLALATHCAIPFDDLGLFAKVEE